MRPARRRDQAEFLTGTNGDRLDFSQATALAGLQTLRKDAANCAVIRDRATDQRKRELYDRLSQHLNPLADEVAWAMAKARDQN